MLSGVTNNAMLHLICLYWTDFFLSVLYHFPHYLNQDFTILNIKIYLWRIEIDSCHISNTSRDAVSIFCFPRTGKSLCFVTLYR